MFKRLSCKELLVIIACSLGLVFLSIPGVHGQERGLSQARDHNQRGMEYFNKGFFDHTPRQQEADAEKNYGLAVKEFMAAISSDPLYPEPHKNLARLFYLKKNFGNAAIMYQRVTELDPEDLDAYVNLALALIELKRFNEAIQALERAKTRTSDPKVQEKLDSYIAKIQAHQSQEVN